MRDPRTRIASQAKVWLRKCQDVGILNDVLADIRFADIRKEIEKGKEEHSPHTPYKEKREKTEKATLRYVFADANEGVGEYVMMPYRWLLNSYWDGKSR